MTPRTLSFAGCSTRSEAADLLRVFVEQKCVDDLLAMQADDATIAAAEDGRAELRDGAPAGVCPDPRAGRDSVACPLSTC
jgi:hypothetical protein